MSEHFVNPSPMKYFVIEFVSQAPHILRKGARYLARGHDDREAVDHALVHCSHHFERCDMDNVLYELNWRAFEFRIDELNDDEAVRKLRSMDLACGNAYSETFIAEHKVFSDTSIFTSGSIDMVRLEQLLAQHVRAKMIDKQNAQAARDKRSRHVAYALRNAEHEGLANTILQALFAGNTDVDKLCATIRVVNGKLRSVEFID